MGRVAYAWKATATKEGSMKRGMLNVLFVVGLLVTVLLLGGVLGWYDKSANQPELTNKISAVVTTPTPTPEPLDLSKFIPTYDYRHPRVIPPYGTSHEYGFGMPGSLWAEEVMRRGTLLTVEGAVTFVKTLNGHMWALDLEVQDQNGNFLILQLKDDCRMGEFVTIPPRCIVSEKRWTWNQVVDFVKTAVNADEYYDFAKSFPPFLKKYCRIDVSVDLK
ncbi:MAG: hypothetical protein WC705_03340 [Candidatus Paceibacterota bacterium]|jgi:hypothetical protein